MRAFRSPSAWLRGLSRRERLFIAGGAVIGGSALAFALFAGPLLERWTSREAALEANRQRGARLQALVASESALRQALQTRRRDHAATMQLLLVGATPALAASNLQAQLQQYADESFVQLNRVDVVGEPKAERPGLVAIPVVLQGQGDVYGLVDYLYRLQYGQRLLVIDDIAINSRSGWLDKDQTLLWTVRAHGLYPAPEGS
jgi:type II secretion system (T2SS) protein M